jgi:hypothetical protein
MCLDRPPIQTTCSFRAGVLKSKPDKKIIMDQQQPAGNSSLFELNLDGQNSFTLRTAAGWAKVLGVCGILIGLFLSIVCLAALGSVGQSDNYSYRRGAFQGLFGYDTAQRVGLWMIIIMGIIFILGGVFSFSFGNRINSSLKSNNQQGLSAAFAALRNYFAVRSITLIVCALFILLALIQSI